MRLDGKLCVWWMESVEVLVLDAKRTGGLLLIEYVIENKPRLDFADYYNNMMVSNNILGK